MKRIGLILATLLLFTLLIQSGAARADEPAVHLFLVTGQSNTAPNGNGQLLPPAMRHVDNAWYAKRRSASLYILSPMEPFRAPKPKFGITNTAYTVEHTIAYNLHLACPDMRMVFVRVASGGTSLVAWDPHPNTPEWKQAMAAVGNAGKKAVYPQVVAAVNATRAAVSVRQELGGRPVEMAGVFYIQTERDSKMLAGAQQYEWRLRDLIAAFRHEWAEPGLPVVFMDSHTALNASAALVRQAAANVAELQPADISDERGATAVPGTAMVATRDLPKYNDGVHFNSEGINRFGARLAERWLELNGGCD
jgi:hypothetical protein